MKNEKNPLQITHISWEDFKKLDLKGYEHRRHYYKQECVDHEDGSNSFLPEKRISYNETGEFVTDSKGGKHWVNFDDVYMKTEWEEVSINKIVEENIEFSKKQGWTRPICVAIHDDKAEEKRDEHFFNLVAGTRIMCVSDEKSILYGRGYLDKFLTQLGMQTYLIRCDVPHLYSRRNYFYTKDDYFQVDKRETKAIYLIYWN